jgi:hypothetical protein
VESDRWSWSLTTKTPGLPPRDQVSGAANDRVSYQSPGGVLMRRYGPHFANGRASQAISRAGRLEKSVLLAVTGDEKAISRDL